MTEYIDKDAYYEFLDDCDIGIFNNNRQQAMGNINAMLGMGKKVYIRSSTCMWDFFRGKGAVLFPVEEIQKQSFRDFISFPADIRDRNTKIYDENNPTENSLNAWVPLLRKVVAKNKKQA